MWRSLCESRAAICYLFYVSTPEKVKKKKTWNGRTQYTHCRPNTILNQVRVIVFGFYTFRQKPIFECLIVKKRLKEKKKIRLRNFHTLTRPKKNYLRWLIIGTWIIIDWLIQLYVFKNGTLKYLHIDLYECYCSGLFSLYSA